MAREDVDLVVQIPLDAEYLQFVSIFPTRDNRTDGPHLTYFVDAPGGLRVIVIKQEKMGPTAATNACVSALERFSPRLYICLGIAGGISKDVNLGDVCFTGNLADVLGNSKVKDGVSGGMDLEFSPDFYETPRRLTAAASFIRTMTEIRPSYLAWQNERRRQIESLALGAVPGRAGPEHIGEPKALDGFLICGSVAQSKTYQESLKGVTRNPLAIETESGSVFNICRDRQVNVMAIRGISDYGDEGKSKLEGVTKDAVRDLAVLNAASFLHLELGNGTFLEAIRDANAAAPVLPLVVSHKKPTLPDVLDRVTLEVDQKLRELSPQYRTKPTGYRLPPPRLRETGSTVVDERTNPRSLELVAALSSHKHLMVYVPRTYPDPALPWILANGLLPSEVGEKKLVPVVVDGGNLAPPRSGLEKAASIPLDKTLLECGGEYVFIIDNPQVASDTRRKFLLEEMKRWDGHRFIFVTREDQSFIREADFERLAPAASFDVCDVSFSEMAAFIESAFELPPAQAEVIALQLRTMFRRFSLPAHPSFFAGIPPEMLAALLAANKRSELIQLAVDGYLSFIVASDKQPVKLSRRNRSNFLRRLVVELCVNKRSFTQAELVDYAQRMSDEFDYGLNALSFIQTFEDKGIINFDNGNVQITLPFIRAYLLADELSKSTGLAKIYFDPDNGDFDLLCFDLYSEIGPSEEIIEQVRRRLDAAIEAVSDGIQLNILLTNEVSPAYLRGSDRIKALSHRVREAKEVLETGASERQEKIKILDLVDRVNEDVAKAQGGSKSKNHVESDKAMDDLADAWLIATVLLGSGAENIRGQERLGLTTAVLRGGDCLMHAWTKSISNIDFEAIKTDLLKDDEFRKEIGIAEESDFKRLIGVIFDLVEFVVLSMPLERVVSQLLDHAKHRIIGNSVTKAQVDAVIAKLLRGLWLTEIDPKEGSPELRAAIASLPDARFLRACLTSLMIHRVKWKLSEKVTRLALLDFAEAVVKPLNPHLDKGELIRFVERDGINNLLE